MDTVRSVYRELSPADKDGVRIVKEAGQDLINAIENRMKPGRERSLAPTKAEEAVMWAVKGITG